MIRSREVRVFLKLQIVQRKRGALPTSAARFGNLIRLDFDPFGHQYFGNFFGSFPKFVQKAIKINFWHDY